MELAFETLPNAEELQDLTNLKALKGYPNRYRIRVGDYRVGIEVHGDKVEMMRVLHRRATINYDKVGQAWTNHPLNKVSNHYLGAKNLG